MPDDAPEPMPIPPVIRRWSDIGGDTERLSEIQAIFFEASATKSFASDTEHAEFQERWLGRYLTHDPRCFYVALAPAAIGQSGVVAGYLAGSFDDPARTARFADIGYFADLAGLTARYPANLPLRIRSASIVAISCAAGTTTAGSGTKSTLVSRSS